MLIWLSCELKAAHTYIEKHDQQSYIVDQQIKPASNIRKQPKQNPEKYSTISRIERLHRLITAQNNYID